MSPRRRLARALCAVSLLLLASCAGSPSAPAPVPTPTPVPDLAGLYRFEFQKPDAPGCRTDHFSGLGWDVILVQTGTTFTLQFQESMFGSGRVVGRLTGNSVTIELTITQRGDPPHVNEWRGTGSGTLQEQDVVGQWQGTVTCPAPSHGGLSCTETRQFRIRRIFR